MASEAHHARAQELLHRIDQARRQRDGNATHRHGLLDAEDRLCAMYEQLFVQRLRDESLEAFNSAQEALKSYEQRLSFTHTAQRHEDERYANDCGLEMPRSQLVDEDAVCSARAVDTAVGRLGDLRKEADATDDYMVHFFSAAEQVCLKMNDVVARSSIESDRWLPVLNPVLDALEKILTQQPIHVPLQVIVDKLKTFARHDCEMRERQAASVVNGRVAENDELTQNRMSLMEGITDLVTHKFRIIAQYDEGPVAGLQKETARIRSETTVAAETLLRETAQRRQTLSADKEKIEDQQQRAGQDETLARAGFEEALRASDEVLLNNAAEQRRCWDEMCVLEKRLIELGSERRAEIDRRTGVTEREERRRCDMANFQDFARRHTQLVSRSLTACEAEESLGTMMQEVVLHTCAAIDRKVLSLKATLDETRAAAYVEHGERFQEQYLLLGDLMFRKERAMEELGRKVDMLNMQVDAAMDNFDPKAKVLSEQRTLLEDEKARLGVLVEQLKARADKYIEAFKPTERALFDRNIPFRHPLDKLKELNRDRSSRLDQYHAAAALDADVLAAAQSNSVDATIVASAAEIDAERQDIADIRASYQPRTKEFGEFSRPLKPKRTAGGGIDPFPECQDGDQIARPIRSILPRHLQALREARGAGANNFDTAALAEKLGRCLALDPALEPQGGRALTQLDTDPFAEIDPELAQNEPGAAAFSDGLKRYATEAEVEAMIADSTKRPPPEKAALYKPTKGIFVGGEHDID